MHIKSVDASHQGSVAQAKPKPPAGAQPPVRALTAFAGLVTRTRPAPAGWPTCAPGIPISLRKPRVSATLRV